VAIQPNLPGVMGDPSRITQLLTNLIGNAVKYSPGGGDITVTVRPSGDHRVVRVAVADQGLGLAPDDITGLFQPFMRTEAALASGIEGTDLGLAICQEIAQAHGGRLIAESLGLGLGSTFILELPAARQVSVPDAPVRPLRPDPDPDAASELLVS
jgi:signal transduction histidine kinase